MFNLLYTEIGSKYSYFITILKDYYKYNYIVLSPKMMRLCMGQHRMCAQLKVVKKVCRGAEKFFTEQDTSPQKV